MKIRKDIRKIDCRDIEYVRSRNIATNSDKELGRSEKVTMKINSRGRPPVKLRQFVVGNRRRAASDMKY